MSTMTVINPATGQPLGAISIDDDATVARKAAAARQAQVDWAQRPLAQRQQVMVRFRQAVVDQLDVLATTLTQEVGKPIAQSRNELNGLLGRLDFFIEHAQAACSAQTVHTEAGLREVISYEPLGVVANISAWNYPWFVGCNVLVPALLMGNAVLYKPSELALLTGQHITRLLHDCGIPPDVLQLVVGDGRTGSALLAQPIDGLFFTGSHATGVKIAQTLASRLVKVQLELGGKDPAYVRSDANAQVAAQSLADGAMYNTGQSCCSVERIYVDAQVYDAFLDHFLATVDGFKQGDPMHPDTYIGAITRPAQLELLEEQVQDAVSRGATLRRGGHRRPGPGNWFEPTVLTEVNHTMLVMREESFGPIIGIQKVTDDDEALALMNDSRYGLTAGVYTQDEAAAQRLLSRVRAGSAYWNCCDRVSPRLPWSGVGDSGIGLTLSVEGIRTFTRPKAWHLRSPA